MKPVFIVAAARTPIGSFGGSLSSLTAIQLGGIAIREALKRSGVAPESVDELFFGNVISAGLGQAPATQLAAAAGMGFKTPATLINKVCASGMKAIMLGAQSIELGLNEVVVAGGTESMSNIPYLLTKARTGYKYGHGELIDALQFDGLTDPYNHCAMGVCADNTAKEMGITREVQDAYAIQSYQRSEAAWKAGAFNAEVVPVELTDRKGNITLMAQDEEYKNVNFDKIPGLKPVFTKDGTVTAANASTLNDGACAVILASEAFVNKHQLKPLAVIRGYGDAAQDPMWFTTTPSLAIPIAIQRAGLTASQIDYYEINEAFAAVAIANNLKLNLNEAQVNVYGGAVSLGHPLGASGARITTTLISVLKGKSGKYGVAGICNGGGGASAIVLENL